MEKVCARCKVKQDINNFHKANREPCGHVSNCKKCRQEILRKFHEKHPGVKREYSRKWRENNRDKIHKHYRANAEKIRKQARERWLNNPKVREYATDYRFKKSYGISLKDFNLMVEKQNGLCLICKKPPNNNKKSDNLYIDHDHKTGKIRGLLCHKCNAGLGSFNDNVVLLEEAIKYLSYYLRRKQA